MTDFRDPNDPRFRDDPLARNTLPPNVPLDDARSTNATWGWVAAAVFVAVVLFIAFSSGRDNVQTASNIDNAPAAQIGSGPTSPLTPPAAVPATPTPTPAPAPTGSSATP